VTRTQKKPKPRSRLIFLRRSRVARQRQIENWRSGSSLTRAKPLRCLHPRLLFAGARGGHNGLRPAPDYRFGGSKNWRSRQTRRTMPGPSWRWFRISAAIRSTSWMASHAAANAGERCARTGYRCACLATLDRNPPLAARRICVFYRFATRLYEGRAMNRGRRLRATSRDGSVAHLTTDKDFTHA
jgi:hypothetical protein